MNTTVETTIVITLKLSLDELHAVKNMLMSVSDNADPDERQIIAEVVKLYDKAWRVSAYHERAED